MINNRGRTHFDKVRSQIEDLGYRALNLSGTELFDDNVPSEAYTGKRIMSFGLVKKPLVILWEEKSHLDFVSPLPTAVAASLFGRWGVILYTILINERSTKIFNNKAGVEIDDLQALISPAGQETEGLDIGYRKELALEQLRSPYQKLQSFLDYIHNRIYGTPGAGVTSTNDCIDEISKLIFIRAYLNETRDPNGEWAWKKRDLNGLREFFERMKDGSGSNVADDRFTGIFTPYDHLRLSNKKLLRELLEGLDEFWRTDIKADILGRVYDVFLRGKFHSGAGLGVYLTPKTVVGAMVSLTLSELSHGDLSHYILSGEANNLRICDPCCGTGSFLLGIVNRLRAALDRIDMPSKERSVFEEHLLHRTIHGADSNASMTLKCKINLLLYGISHNSVHLVTNSLTEDLWPPASFDVILTNPPFKQRGYNREAQPEVWRRFSEQPFQGKSTRSMALAPDSRGRWKPVKSIDPAILFLDYCLYLLKPKGLLCIVLPNGILSSKSLEYVRRYFFGKSSGLDNSGPCAYPLAVVSLPTLTFDLAGSHVKTSFLLLRKAGFEEEDVGCLMAKAAHIGFIVKNKREIFVPQNDLPSIVLRYQELILTR